MSISSTASQSHVQLNAPLRLGAQVVLVLVAIALFSLAAAALGVRGSAPPDGAISWEFSGE